MRKNILYSLVAFLAVAALVSPTVAGADEGSERIVGGEDADIMDFPHHVRVEITIPGQPGFISVCGGSIVAPDWIVTAAHCTDNFKGTAAAGNIWIHAGITDLADRGPSNRFEVTRNIVHPGYDPSIGSAHDISLLELDSAIPGALGTPIGLNHPSTPAELNEDVKIVGWGTTSFGGPTSQILQKATVEVQAGRHAKTCGQYDQFSVLPSIMLCAGVDPGGIDSCQGDSGGGALLMREGEYVLAGVVSFGIGCAEAEHPGIYTRVASYYGFVAEYVPGVDCDINGTPGDDLIFGTPKSEVICAGDGDDTVAAKFANDVIEGGPGNDDLIGGKGDDVLFGGPGSDELQSNGGFDGLFGLTGNDFLAGGNGADQLLGERGSDDIFTGTGDDIAIAGKGNDLINGGLGFDQLDGSRGHDTITGGPRDDYLIGGPGNDSLNGGADFDIGEGNAGADVCVNVEIKSSC